MTNSGPIRLKPSIHASLLKTAKETKMSPEQFKRILANRSRDRYERSSAYRDEKNQELIEKLPEIEAAMEKDFNEVYKKLPIRQLYKLIDELKHIRQNTFMLPIEKELTDRRIEVARVCLSVRLTDLERAVESHLKNTVSKKWHKKMEEQVTTSDIIQFRLMDGAESFISKYADEDKEHEINKNKEKNKYYNAKKDEEGLYMLNDYQYEDIFESSGKMKKFDAKGRLVDVKKKKKKNKTEENKKNHPILNKVANLVKRVKDLFYFILETFIPGLKKDSKKTAKMIKKEARKAVKILTANAKGDVETGDDIMSLSTASSSDKKKKKKKKHKK